LAADSNEYAAVQEFIDEFSLEASTTTFGAVRDVCVRWQGCDLRRLYVCCEELVYAVECAPRRISSQLPSPGLFFLLSFV
jgi:hypothetical protein